MRLRPIACVLSALAATALLGFLVVAAIDDVAPRRSSADRTAAVLVGAAAATLVLATVLRRWWLWLLPAAAWVGVAATALPFARRSGLSYVCGTVGGCFEVPYTTTSGWIVLSVLLAGVAALVCGHVAVRTHRAGRSEAPLADRLGAAPPSPA